MMHGCTHGETQGSAVPFVSWFSSNALHTVQTGFPLEKNERSREVNKYDQRIKVIKGLVDCSRSVIFKENHQLIVN